jgi:Golgi apparatus protein 1
LYRYGAVWMSGDWRYKYALAARCASERQVLCHGVSPGGARVIRCLQGKQAGLPLFTTLSKHVGTFHHVILQSKHGSTDEAGTVHVNNLTPGSEQPYKQEDPKMGAECRKAVFEDQKRSHDDIRLHLELRTSCDADTQELCADVTPGEGRVIKCLRDARLTIKAGGCVQVESSFDA